MIPSTKVVAARSRTGTLTKMNFENTRAYSSGLASKTEPYVSGAEFSV
jgi:hypothetical protein